MNSEEFLNVKMEDDDDDDDEPVIIESSPAVDVQNGLPMEDTSQASNESQYMARLSYEGDDLSSLTSAGITRMSHHASIRNDVNSTEEMEYGFPRKRRRAPSILANSDTRIRDQEYEDSTNVMYEYDAEYDCASITSEGSYMGDQQRTLTEVLNYCQAMYDIVQKLDKKLDMLQRKVSEMHHARMKPHFKLSNKRMVEQKPPQSLVEAMPESTCVVSSPSISGSLASSSVRPTTSETSFKEMKPTLMNCVSSPRHIVISEELPSSSVPWNPGYEYLGELGRNIKVPGNYLMKARQKTKPKYAARYLVRVLFPRETLLCSTMGTNARGLRTLDVNKVSAIREFLSSVFPAFDLGEYGKDWKTCITNVNAMIRCIRSEIKTATVKSDSNQTSSQVHEESILVDSDANDGEEEAVSEEAPQTSQKTTGITTTKPINPQGDMWEPDTLLPGSSVKPASSDPMEYFGENWRNVQLPFSVIYIAKGKSRPELSARYLVRHLFTEDVLVKSNVYGNLERGVLPLDCNKISALKDFLQMNYPTFDLKESGYDWKACVAAINSSIRSLRHDQKKVKAQPRNKPQAAKKRTEITLQREISLKTSKADTINLAE
ncbi:BEN domain-containing protein 2 isoform X3 [Ascaphus truei]|uniref:BEN domain-containing protein 2 isoform X3 n=1 Tax=Ascaphus truei TaxID=8439 RepID=UPI003F5A5791